MRGFTALAAWYLQRMRVREEFESIFQGRKMTYKEPEESLKEKIGRLEKETFFDRIFYGFACSLFGAAIVMAILFWADVTGTALLFCVVMGIAFLGGCFFGARFLNLVGDVLKRIW
jgi:FtsH-binding integral membrane protein